jgi:multisubunit Na+/H+ antiporter MnhB subunit
MSGLLDFVIGTVFLVLGALAFRRATQAADPKLARRDWIGAALCTIAGLIFWSIYLFSSGPRPAPKEAPPAVQGAPVTPSPAN